ncbi:MAG: DUF5723 family protein [Bacteroidota bacterium]
MTGKPKYLLILIMAMIIAEASAQNSQVLYYMNLPQNHLINPALRPSNSLYIGLPVMSGINLNINNNFVNFSDVFMKGQKGDSVISFLHPDNNVDDFLAKIKDKNSLEPETSFQLFGLGFSAGKDMYFFLDINDRIAGNIVFPGDLFKLALKGNEGFVGSKIDLSSLRGDLKYYREVGLGFSRNFTNNLRIGVKGKLLFGIAGVSIDNRSLGITVNDNYSHSLDADLVVNISGPVTVTKDNNKKINGIDFDDSRFKTAGGIADFILGKKNLGLGLDIGATYNISDKIVVSAAITDLGFIKWKKDVTNLKAKSRFEFSGLNMLDVINGTKTFDELGQEMLDSLENSFIVSDSNIPFTTYLPFGVTFGGSYSLTNRISFGLLSYSRVIGKQIRESLTLSANVNLGNALSTSLSYTVANHRFDNLGAGLAFRTGIVQFFMLADKIPVMWNKIKIDNKSTIPLPASWNTINLRLGMNIVFGNRIRKKEDKPMILVE